MLAVDQTWRLACASRHLNRLLQPGLARELATLLCPEDQKKLAVAHDPYEVVGRFVFSAPSLHTAVCRVEYLKRWPGLHVVADELHVVLVHGSVMRRTTRAAEACFDAFLRAHRPITTPVWFPSGGAGWPVSLFYFFEARGCRDLTKRAGELLLLIRAVSASLALNLNVERLVERNAARLRPDKRLAETFREWLLVNKAKFMRFPDHKDYKFGLAMTTFLARQTG